MFMTGLALVLLYALVVGILISLGVSVVLVVVLAFA
jgi:hypothetical protein